MKIYKHQNDEYRDRRVHPWDIAESNPLHRFYNFKENPNLIRTVLEDFIPWNKWPAVEKFYEIIEWINSKDSVYESNDCAISGPKQNTDNKFPKTLQCSGRLMILYRNLLLNTSVDNMHWLEGATHHYFNKIDTEFEWGVIGTSILNVQYIELPLPEEKQYGTQLSIMFWAWGDTDNECMSNLFRVFKNMHDALEGISNEIKESVNH